MTTYEAHITFPGRLHRKVKRRANETWKFSRMVGDPVFGPGKYCYLTTYYDDFDVLKEAIELRAEGLTNAGIAPLRLKIEEELYDRKLTQ